MQSSVRLDLDRLRHSLAMLRLLHYRNKNQHHRSTWWGTLCAVKVCVQKLINEIADNALMRVRTRCSFMEADLLPRCYRSFSQVVPDSQFSVLGIALLAETARIHAIIDPIDDLLKISENVDEAQGTLRASRIPPSGLKELEEVGHSVQRPASSSPLAQSAARGALFVPDAPLSQSTDRTVIRSLATAEHKRLREPKSIDELFRAVE
ncbi:MAG: hypothetical protein LQ349_000800 [Xanthoria aureola]|nr:MAG: hypothetical protein LQ349_000800 [Xanthoria aureola]